MASKVPGYKGQLLEIDLTSESINEVDLDPELARNYIGGRAMGGKMLLDAYGTKWADIDPLSPDALLLVLAGPFVNFMGCKTNFVYKSPQSFAIMASQGSGDFVHELRFSGYDGIVLKGKANSPVYITIFDDKVEIKDASNMWGKATTETHKMIVDEYGNQTSQCYLGPAGENLVKISAIMTEWYRAAARGGPGAVMGSKNLKAIICRGTGPAPEVADQKKVNELMTWGRENNHLMRLGFHEYGTAAGIFSAGNARSEEPVRNWQSEWHDDTEDSGKLFAAEHWLRRYWSDYGCSLACSKLGRVKYGKRAGTIVELPDYELGAFEGTNWGIFDINEMAHTCFWVDELGLDAITTGTVCGFACEAQQKGILTAADLGGLQLKWGDADGFVELMKMIAYRKGEIPTLLGEGLVAATKKIGKGSEAFAVMVKNIPVGAHGVRSREGGELNYSVASQGGDHQSTVRNNREDALFADSAGKCNFAGYTRDQEMELLQAITGFGISKDEMETVMIPRWMTMNRISLLLSGWTYKDDANPPRFYEPLPDGPQKGGKVNKAVENAKKQGFYRALGWDSQGVPTTETLQKCGFEAFDSALARLRTMT